MVSGRIYPHFCMMARAAEEIGERWTLLIVRDLLLGPRRFTDLTASLAGITPTRLTDRLRSLEQAGLVLREPASEGREVWYRLTPAGQDLAPAIEALNLWGIKHALSPPVPGEAIHPDHVMFATKAWLMHYGKQRSRRIVWAWELPDHDYTLRYEAGQWSLQREKADSPTVTVVTTPYAWARFITQGKDRRLPGEDIELIGRPASVRAFAAAFAAELDA